MSRRADLTTDVGPLPKLYARLRQESGYSLTELLVVMLILTLVLGAVASLLDRTQARARNDQERTLAVNDATAGLAKLETDLRRACALFTTSTTSGNYCGSTTAFAPGTTSCTSSANCVDFIIPTRQSGGTNWRRMVYDCSVADGSNGTFACMRYATAPTTTLSTLSVSPSASTTLAGQTNRKVIRSLNSSANIFTYCLNSDYGLSTCTSTVNPTTAQVVRVTLDIARKGTRVNGLPGTFRFNDAVDLKNINRQNAP